MKKIIILGDSLTWGENPETNERYHFDKRWTTIVDERISNKDILPISIPGLAIEIKPWSVDSDGWCSTQNLFFEKSLKAFEGDFEDIYMFLGTNNYKARTKMPVSPKEVIVYYQNLINSIKERIQGVKNIYVMLLPNMSGAINPSFTLQDLNKELLTLENVNGFVDLSGIVIKSKDNVHFSENNNQQIADKVSDFINRIK